MKTLNPFAITYEWGSATLQPARHFVWPDLWQKEKLRNEAPRMFCMHNLMPLLLNGQKFKSLCRGHEWPQISWDGAAKTHLRLPEPWSPSGTSWWFPKRKGVTVKLGWVTPDANRDRGSIGGERKVSTVNGRDESKRYDLKVNGRQGREK